MDDKIAYQDMQKILMDELRLMHYPIAVKFIFKDEELEDFVKNASYFEAVKPLTFCQFEIAARMKGQTVLGTKEKLGCSNASFVFGWKPFDDAEVKTHLKYAKNWDQAVKFVKTKPRLPEGALKAFIVSPLADSYFAPDTSISIVIICKLITFWLTICLQWTYIQFIAILLLILLHAEATYFLILKNQQT